ncbi:hypothetical protein PVAP13_1KG064800 [Panicum virgatum]|uniref:Uncharacterized protein n=1 Tax=Panicum virgatum TaxID=38727 RepID=A0A8T0X365_PANVG|nr:hypothetical protein PVAP13_1KG064800 [Panicum virgatum]
MRTHKMSQGLRMYPIHHQQAIIISNVSGKGKEQGMQQCLRKRRMQKKNLRRREARKKKKEYQNSMETNSSRAPFGDLTNQTNGGVESESNLQSANNSAEQRKRERERTRYAVFSQEEKNARCMRQREVRRKKKGARCISFLWCYNITCNLDGSIFQGCIKLLDLLILRSALEH